MSKEKRTSTGSEEQEAKTDPLIRKIAAAFPEWSMPTVRDEDEDDSGVSADDLTEADRQALASLGTPEELVSRVIAKSEASLQAKRSTRVPSPRSTVPVPGSAYFQETSRDLDELMQNLATFERAHQLSWTSRYRKLGEIGRGGQGVVYLVQCQEEFSVSSALKIFSPAPYGDARAYDEDMRRIAHVASRVHRIHPDNLLNVERFVNHDGIHAIVTQWIDGYDLGQLLQSTPLDKLSTCVGAARWAELTDVVFTLVGPRQLRLKPGIAVYVIEKCLQGADALHGNRMVHGDIKPSNIMLDCYGSVKLIDIGSAFELDAPPKRHTLTPLYVPPEFLAHGKLTPQSDLASLGYVLIELLSGRPAITHVDTHVDSTMTSDKQKNKELLEAKLELPNQLSSLLPSDVQESDHLMNFCRRLIEPEPSKRFPSAADAIVSREGTFNFNKQLAASNLTVHFNRVIKGWLEDVKRVER